MTPVVHVDIRERIATITLDSPSNRNALSQQLLDELADHLATAGRDPGVGGVMLTATGTTFCSGADLKNPPRPDSGGVTLPAVMTMIWEFPKPVVIKLNGHVRAGGTGLVAAADIVVAPTSATFAFTEVRIGVSPAIISVLCVRRMASRALSRYCLTGEAFDARAAEACGLVTLAVEPGQLDPVTAELLAAIRLTEPNAVGITKRLLRELPTRDISDGFAEAEAISAALFASEAAAEGMLAFREKRPPKWAR